MEPRIRLLGPWKIIFWIQRKRVLVPEPAMENFVCPSESFFWGWKYSVQGMVQGDKAASWKEWETRAVDTSVSVLTTAATCCRRSGLQHAVAVLFLSRNSQEIGDRHRWVERVAVGSRIRLKTFNLTIIIKKYLEESFAFAVWIYCVSYIMIIMIICRTDDRISICIWYVF